MEDHTHPLPHPMLDSSQILAYLKHISFPGSDSPEFSLGDIPPPSYELLCQLMWCHLGTVPFENLVLHYGDGIVRLDVGALWDKIVGRQLKDIDRVVGGGFGGYCMEVNLLFLALLRGCGFHNAWSTGGKVSNTVITSGADRSGTFSGWNHIAILVTVQSKTYLVDVGFGVNVPTQPLLLVPEVVTPGCAPQAYRLVQRTPRSYQNRNLKNWVLQIKNQYGDGEGAPGAGDWLDAYMFNPEVEFGEEDYEVMSYVVSRKEGTIFTEMVLCVKAILDMKETMGEDGVLGKTVVGVKGRLIMAENTVKERIGGEVKVLATFQNENDRVEALEKYFGIKLNDKEKASINERRTKITKNKVDPYRKF
ncbi:hypothetical protein BDZ91DRAFT_711198 [Kalaharituber pfeilii]|nr:hypothetical protein BDZ91DRAFT_711198 [Kalaharituber pfeilii]